MRRDPPRSASERIYALLIRTYPPTFFRNHRDEMLAWFRQHRAATVMRGGALEWTRFWAAIARDFVETMPAEHVAAISGRRRSARSPRVDRRRGDLSGDLRFAVRGLARSPGFALACVLTIGLGVGAATTVYSIAHGVLVASLPYPDPHRLVRVGEVSSGRAGILSVSALDLEDLQARSRSFDALVASRPSSLTLRGDQAAERVRAAMVSAAFFEMLGAQPTLGRAWGEEEDKPDGEAVVVLSHGLWQRRWAGDPTVIGRELQLDGRPFTVVGVAPADFIPPEALYQRGTELWIPLAFVDPDARSNRRDGFLQLIGRLRRDVDRATAVAELRSLGPEISADYPEPGERAFGLAPLHDETIGQAADRVLPLLGAVGILLAVTCLNVGTLLLVRGMARAPEMAVRLALGAPRRRLVRLALAETLLLGALGGLVGALVAGAGVRGFLAFAPSELPRLPEIRVEPGILGIAVLISLLTGLLAGLLPALRSSRQDPADGLRLRRGRRGGPVSMGLRDTLVVGEVALSVVLVVGAGLLVSSFAHLSRVELGFNAADTHLVTVTLPDSPSDDEVLSFLDQVTRRFRRIPGVVAVGATVNAPLSGNYRQQRIIGPDIDAGREDLELGGYPVNYQQVTAGYFEALEIPVVRGRSFDRRDRVGSAPVALVNEALAAALFGGENPLGRSFNFGDAAPDAPAYEIVGVVADYRQQRLEAPGEPELYLSFAQRPAAHMEIVARTTPTATGPIARMREQVWAMRAELPVLRAVSLRSVVAESTAGTLFYTVLLGSFATLGMILALVGVYGTVAYSVSRRQRELGIRMTLGASRCAVVVAVLRRSLAMVTVGIGLGTAIALPSVRALAAFLYGVTPTDAPTVVVALTAILAAALVAGAVPARRATRIDPVGSLRRS